MRKQIQQLFDDWTDSQLPRHFRLVVKQVNHRGEPGARRELKRLPNTLAIHEEVHLPIAIEIHTDSNHYARMVRWDWMAEW